MKKIIAVISLSFAFYLLSGCSFACAEASEAWGDVEITPSVSYINLTGDKEKLAEDYWVQKGAAGGVSEFSLIKEHKDGYTVDMEAKGIVGSNGSDNFNFDFSCKKDDLGEVNFEFKQFRKYYDGTGGFWRDTPVWRNKQSLLDTGRELFMDIGNFKIEGVLAKEKFPKLTASYEREYRKGAKSLTSWGDVTNYASWSIKILPTFLEIDEIVDKVSMKIEDMIKGVDISAEQTWEQAGIDMQKCNNRTLNLATGVFSDVRYKYEDIDSDIYTTTIRAAKEFNEKIFFSSGFIYKFYRDYTKERITDTSASAWNENHPENPANVGQSTVTFFNKLSIILAEKLLLDAGLRWEYVDTDGVANYDRDTGTAPNGARDEYVRINTEVQENRIGESVGLKYDGIKNIVLYASAGLEQQIRGINDKEDHFGTLEMHYGNVLTGGSSWSRDATVNAYDYEVTPGFKWYVMPKIDVTTELKFKYKLLDYDNDSKARNTGDVRNGYNGFIDDISFTTYKPVVAVNFKPFKRLKGSFRYTLDSTTYGVRTPVAAAIELARYMANTYSFTMTFTPHDSLCLTGLYEYRQASTKTQANGDGLTNPNQPTYNANVEIFSASCGYSPVKNATIRGSYSLSSADDYNDFSRTGLPLGIQNISQSASFEIENKVTASCTLDFKYDLMQYGEDSNMGIDNYIAHMFYAGVNTKF